MSRKRTKLRPHQKAGEEKLNRHWRALFLQTLAETSNVTAAAKEAGANPARAYKLRRENADFRREWAAALLEGYEHLEMETLHRLRFGSGPDDPKFDIPNALRLLAAHREMAARERARQTREDEAEVLASLKAKIALMRERKQAAKRILAESGITADTEPHGRP